MLLGLGLSIVLFLSTALLTWAWVSIARAKQIQDQPEHRRLHQVQIPRAGGISIALVMIVTSAVIFFLSPVVGKYWSLVSVAIILYGSLGFWDDLKPIPTRVKLFLHLLVAGIIFLVALLPSSSGLIPSLVIALAYLLLVNTWNFMDGSNGLVGMQSLLVVIGFLALSHFTSATYYYALALAVACLGFLPFNFPVARVFLGDVGSHVLGAAVVGLALLAYDEAQWTVLEILCLTSALWVDAMLTFSRRSLRRFKVTKPHRSHLYQYAVRIGQSHTAVCLYYAAWTAGVISVIGVSRQLSELGQRILLLAVIASACVLHQSLRLFVLKSSKTSAQPKQLL